MDEKYDTRKKAVSWYIDKSPGTSKENKSEDDNEVEVVWRKHSGRRNHAKSKSLDPKQETKMTINSARIKSTIEPPNSVYDPYELRMDIDSLNSLDCLETTQTRSYQRGCYRKAKLNTQLLEAIENCDIPVLNRLLKLGANPNATCQLNHTSACHMAAMVNNESLSLLIESGAEAFRTDKLGRTPLHLAAWVGNPKQIAVLLNLPEDLQNKVALDMSPEIEDQVQHYSSITKHLTNLSCNIGTLSNLPKEWTDSMEHNCGLLKKKLPPFKPGWTALHSASERAQATCVQLLLAAGADANARDLIARTPLDIVGMAYYTGHTVDALYFRKTIRILLNAGGKFSIRGNRPKMGNTPLHTAVELESIEAIEELLSAGASAIRHNKNGLTAMHICVQKRLKEHLQLLANYDYKDFDPYLATVDAKDHMGQTVLHAAVRAHWIEGVCIALGAGASVFMKANDGDSPIHSAAALGDIHILQHLLSVAKYAIDYRNQKGQTALFVAIMKNHLNVVKLLIENGASLMAVLPDNLTVLHVAARCGYTEILDYLLNHDNRVIASLMRSCTYAPITFAVINNQVDCVDLLLRRGADLFNLVEFKDDVCKELVLTTILHIAAAMNYFEIARMIVEFDGQTINKPNGSGLLPLHEACIHGNRDIIALFVRKGADLSRPAAHPKIKQTPVEMVMNNLSKPSAFIEEVFDSNIHSEGKNLQDTECKVMVNYAVFMPNSLDGKQMKVLKALVDTGNRYNQRKLLTHPLVESFLYLKWKALVPFFYAIITLFGLFVLSLNVYVISVFYYQDKNKLNDTDALQKNSTNEISQVPSYLQPEVWKYMLYLSVCLVALQEIIFIKIGNKRYFLLLETWVKFGAIALSIFLPRVVLLQNAELKPVVESSPEWARLMATIALLLSWLEFMFLLSRFPSWGFYVLMFGKVATKVFKILLTFLFLIVGFSLCFMIQFRAMTPFEGPWAAITKTFVMMTSEYDYMNMINENTAKDIAASISILRGIFIIFVILSSIVLMNLMVGVAVNDVNNLADIGNQKRLEKQVDFLTSLEDIVYHKIIRKILPRFNSTLSMRKKVKNKIILRPREATCSYTKILPKYIREAIFEKAQLQKKQIEDIIGSMAYHMKLNEIHEAVVQKDAPSEQLEWSLNMATLNETVTKVNNDIEKLRGELAVIRHCLLRRNSIN